MLLGQKQMPNFDKQKITDEDIQATSGDGNAAVYAKIKKIDDRPLLHWAVKIKR